jgi:sulfide dehydrogenase [flavocytochrome c] flavoprotein subunit
VVAMLGGEKPQEPRLINTCYSVAAPDYGFSIAGVYRPVNGVLTDIPGAGGISPIEAPAEQRVQEAQYGERWFETITTETFG